MREGCCTLEGQERARSAVFSFPFRAGPSQRENMTGGDKGKMARSCSDPDLFQDTSGVSNTKRRRPASLLRSHDASCAQRDLVALPRRDGSVPHSPLHTSKIALFLSDLAGRMNGWEPYRHVSQDCEDEPPLSEAAGESGPARPHL